MSLVRSRWRCSGVAMDGGCTSSFSLLRGGAEMNSRCLRGGVSKDASSMLPLQVQTHGADVDLRLTA